MGVTRLSLAGSPASGTGLRGLDGQESPTAVADLQIVLTAIDQPESFGAPDHPGLPQRSAPAPGEIVVHGHSSLMR
jgi:hypothetical protein